MGKVSNISKEAIFDGGKSALSAAPGQEEKTDLFKHRKQHFILLQLGGGEQGGALQHLHKPPWTSERTSCGLVVFGLQQLRGNVSDLNRGRCHRPPENSWCSAG